MAKEIKKFEVGGVYKSSSTGLLFEVVKRTTCFVTFLVENEICRYKIGVLPNGEETVPQLFVKAVDEERFCIGCGDGLEGDTDSEFCDFCIEIDRQIKRKNSSETTDKENTIMLLIASVSNGNVTLEEIEDLRVDNYSWFKAEDLVKSSNFNASQVGGIMSSLFDKNIIQEDCDEDGLWCFTAKGVEAVIKAKKKQLKEVSTEKKEPSEVKETFKTGFNYLSISDVIYTAVRRIKDRVVFNVVGENGVAFEQVGRVYIDEAEQVEAVTILGDTILSTEITTNKLTPLNPKDVYEASVEVSGTGLRVIFTTLDGVTYTLTGQDDDDVEYLLSLLSGKGLSEENITRVV